MISFHSDGKTHVLDSCAISALVLVSALVLSDTRLVLVSLGCLAGVFVSPDLDQETRTISETLLERLPTAIGKGIGLTVGGLWTAVWGFYAAFIPHRSVLSHLPLLGTGLRVSYLYGWYRVVTFVIGISPAPVSAIPDQAWLVFAGLLLSDTAHFMRDYIK